MKRLVKLRPRHGSYHYPDWICKNGCHNDAGERRWWPEDVSLKRCPHCLAPLVRWLKYEEKK